MGKMSTLQVNLVHLNQIQGKSLFPKHLIASLACTVLIFFWASFLHPLPQDTRTLALLDKMHAQIMCNSARDILLNNAFKGHSILCL